MKFKKFFQNLFKKFFQSLFKILYGNIKFTKNKRSHIKTNIMLMNFYTVFQILEFILIQLNMLQLFKIMS